MTTLILSGKEMGNDSDLWQRVLDSDTDAFEKIVSRHQRAISAVSYSCIGDFTASEDVAQETFLVAWQSRTKLRDASRLRPWLCGIARNLSKNYVRQSAKHKEHAAQLASDLQDSRISAECESESRAMDAEEEALVWKALESIAEVYREPLRALLPRRRIGDGDCRGARHYDGHRKAEALARQEPVA